MAFPTSAACDFFEQTTYLQCNPNIFCTTSPYGDKPTIGGCSDYRHTATGITNLWGAHPVVARCAPHSDGTRISFVFRWAPPIGFLMQKTSKSPLLRAEGGSKHSPVTPVHCSDGRALLFRDIPKRAVRDVKYRYILTLHSFSVSLVSDCKYTTETRNFQIAGLSCSLAPRLPGGRPIHTIYVRMLKNAPPIVYTDRMSYLCTT